MNGKDRVWAISSGVLIILILFTITNIIQRPPLDEHIIASSAPDTNKKIEFQNSQEIYRYSDQEYTPVASGVSSSGLSIDENNTNSPGQQDEEETPATSKHIPIAVDAAGTMQKDRAMFSIMDDVSRRQPYFGVTVKHQQTPSTIPPHVLYVWCGSEERMFEYRHHLSMTSVIRIMKPSNIYFYYKNYPSLGVHEYHNWLNVTADEYPFLRRIQLADDTTWCKGNRTKKQMDPILKELSLNGGFYVHEDTIITEKILDNMDVDQLNAVDLKSGLGFVSLKRGINFTASDNHVTCVKHDELTNLSDDYCVNVNITLYPRDNWEANDTFSELARWVMYGTTEQMYPVPDYDNLAPNIVHYTWPGPGDMDYTWYLSMLSAMYLAKVDLVYVHGEEPSGKYWKLVKDNPKVRFIYRDPHIFVYENEIRWTFAHRSDVMRVDALLKYGGLYLDEDAIIVTPLSDELRSYDAVMSIDYIGYGFIGEWPNVVSNGIMLGKKGAFFWQEFLRTMKEYDDDQWLWNSCHMPYRIKELYPRSLYTDVRFQVDCPSGRCHPTWWRNYQFFDHLMAHNLPNWREDAVAYHMTGKVPPELSVEGAWKNSTSIFAEMVPVILKAAGLPMQ